MPQGHRGRAALAALALALGAGWTAGAVAQVRGDSAVTTPVNPGFLYWSIGASGGVQHLPKWSYGQEFRITESFENQLIIVTVEDLGSAFSYDPKVPGAGPAFAVGYALDPGTFLGRIGTRPRVEFGMWTFFGSTTQSDSVSQREDSFSRVSSVFHDLAFPAVDGSTAYFFRSQDLKLKLESTVYSGEVSMRFKTEYRVSRRLSIVPSVGPIGGLGFYKYKLEGNITGGGFNSVAISPDTAMQVKETIRSYHVGVEGGLNLVFAASPRFLVQGGVAIAGFHRTSHLSARSQFGFPDTFLRRDIGSGGTQVAETSDTGSTFGYRLGFNLGLTYSWGWARLSLTGFGSYDSAVPGVNNPQASSISGAYSSATVKHDGEWVYGGAIALSFPLH